MSTVLVTGANRGIGLGLTRHDNMSSVLITGANRGIGLGLTRHFLADPSELNALNSPKLHIVRMELVNEESIARAVEKVQEIVGEAGLDFLVNNAGVGYNTPLNGLITKAKVVEQFEVNTVAPLLIVNKFYPLLKQAASKNGSAQIANITSNLGSLELAPSIPKELNFSILGMSKAALNMLTRRIAVEWKEDGIRATCFCPGWVRTALGTQEADLSVDESTIPLVKFILSLTEEHNGQYYKHTGERIPW